MSQEKKAHKKREETSSTPPPEVTAQDAKAKKPKATEGVEKLLDEIDDILEENATEFVANYRQRGGE